MRRLLFPLPTELSNINFLSGTLYSIFTHLGKYFEIIPVGPFQLHKSTIATGLNFLYRKSLFPWQFSTVHSWKTVNNYSLQLQKFIDENQFDAVFATSTLYAAKVKTNKPVFAFTDFSYINALNYYPSFSNIWPLSRKESLEVDRFCFNHYTKVFLASEWAKDTTTKAYGLDPDRILSIGRGANLESGFDMSQIEKLIEERNTESSKKFLFVGIDWDRKGGDIAYTLVKKLRESGYNVVLQVVGCNPPNEVSKQSFVEVYPFLSRKKQEELDKLTSLFSKAWCFILPTKAEAMGIVFAEASSFGLPSIAMKTGGVGTAIADNQTGLLFNLSDQVDTILERTLMLLDNPAMYRAFSLSAFQKYKNELNWDTIARKISNEISPYL